MQLQAALEETGIDLLLYNLGHSANRLSEFLVRSVSMRLRGVVIALSDNISGRRAALRQSRRERHSGRVDRSGPLPIRHSLHRARGARRRHRSVSYLLAKGHRRIAYVGRIKGSAVGTERFRGYQAALVKADVFREELVWDMAYRYAAGRDAVSCAHGFGTPLHRTASGQRRDRDGRARGAARSRAKVPDDVSIVGFGDVQMGAYLRPALTTLSSHPELAARHVCSIFKAMAATGFAGVTVLERALGPRESA